MVDETFTSSDVSRMQPGVLAARIGSNVRSWRQGAGVSEADLASCLSIPVETVVSVESGIDSLTAEQIVTICQSFGVKPSRFLDNVA